MARKKLKEEEKKIRLSVSIDSDIHEKLEEYILKHDINRSALVEELLKKIFKKLEYGCTFCYNFNKIEYVKMEKENIY